MNMNKALTFGAGLGIGTGVMFLLDPDRGKRRRALLRDKVAHAARKTNEGAETTAHDLSNRARGIVAQLRSRMAGDEVSDDVLMDRVRSKIGRVVSHPSAIKVEAKNGNVTLSGPILEHEVNGLLKCTKYVRGVSELNNALEVHQEAGDHPSLQGGQTRRGSRFEFMQENWSPAARLVASAAGASLSVYGGARHDALGTGLGAAGLLLLARGVTNVELKRMAGLGDGSREQHSLSESKPAAEPQIAV